MCDKKAFGKLRDRVSKLEIQSAAETEQVKTLFKTTERLQETVNTIFRRLLWVLAAVVMLAVLALIYQALGPNGYQAVTRSAANVLPVK